MPGLSTHHGSSLIKALIIGNSGSGKTGSLESLIRAGYKLRIIDCDNGLDILASRFSSDDPLLSNTQFVTCTEERVGQAGAVKIKGTPKAWKLAMDSLTKWPDDGTNPSEWGPDTVLVIDSLSMLARQCLDYTMALAGRQGSQPQLQDYGMAMRLIEDMHALLYSSAIQCNVIVFTHVLVLELDDGTTRWLPNSLGSKLSPILPRYFNTTLFINAKGSGERSARTLYTQPIGLVDVKNTNPSKVRPSYPLTDGIRSLPGLAEFFRDMGSTWPNKELR